MGINDNRKYLPWVFVGFFVFLVLLSLNGSLTGHAVLVLDEGVSPEQIAYIANHLVGPGDTAITIDEADLSQQGLIIFSHLDESDVATIAAVDGNIVVTGNLEYATPFLSYDITVLLEEHDGFVEIVNGAVVEDDTTEASEEEDEGPLTQCEDDGSTVSYVDVYGQSEEFTDTCSGLDFIDYGCVGSAYSQIKYYCTSGCSAMKGCFGGYSAEEILVSGDGDVAVIEEAYCDDSDGGSEPGSFGEVEGFDGSVPFAYRDECITLTGGSYVMEYSCVAYDDGYYVDSQQIYCEVGCENGACPGLDVSEATCVETDIGVTYTDAFGNVVQYDNSCTSHRDYDTATDSYIDSTSYGKWICENDEPKSTGGWCADGETCGQDASCVSVASTESATSCEVTGAAEFDTTVRGTLTFTNADGNVNTYIDECFVNYNGESWVHENYCDSDGFDDVAAVGDYFCEFGCLEGACHAEAVEAYCEDNAQGTDPYVEESVTIRILEGYFSTSSDYCMGDTLYEYECLGLDAVTVETVCDYGCFGGRCLYQDEEIVYTTCYDSDEDDILTQGELTLVTANYDYVYVADYCIDTNTVAELTCQQDADGATKVKKEVDCDGVCEYGRCVGGMAVEDFMSSYVEIAYSDVVVVIGENAPTGHLLGALRLASMYGLDVVVDTDIDDISSLKAISLGGASVNTVSGQAIDDGAVRSGLYYLYENKETYGVILIVAGDSPKGTRDAVNVLLES
jgi:hypothetical protein